MSRFDELMESARHELTGEMRELMLPKKKGVPGEETLGVVKDVTTRQAYLYALVLRNRGLVALDQGDLGMVARLQIDIEVLRAEISARVAREIPATVEADFDFRQGWVVAKVPYLRMRTPAFVVVATIDSADDAA